jgi:DNA repair protein RadD
MALELRPYQVRGVAQIRAAYAAGHRRVLYQAPTGSGKTVLFAFVVSNAVARGNRVLILAHRVELVDQVAATLEQAGVLYGTIAAGYPERPLSRVQIASIATLAQRLDRYTGAFDFVVIDECHHAVARSWSRVAAAMPSAKLLGVTATPARLDGRGLGSMFDTMVVGPSVAELITLGFLSKYRVHIPAKRVDLSRIRTRAGDYALDELANVMADERLTSDAIADYARICPRVPTVAFCVDIRHSMAVAARFQQQGFRAAHVDGNTPRQERRRLIAALGSGELDVITNCGLFSEGVDVPAIGAAIMLRPTQSLAVFLQQIGRALRPAPGKERALILDHAGNVLRHGLPDEPRAWSLQGTRQPARAPDRASAFARCGACGALNVAGAAACSACGAPMQAPAKAPALIPTDRRPNLAGMSYHEALDWAGESVPRLKLIASVRGYKPGWIWLRVRELREKKKRAAA